jgi:hypothetical protein
MRAMVWVDDHTQVPIEDCLSCRRCRCTLYPGDSYYDIGGGIYCDDCGYAEIDKMKKVVGE